MKKTSLKIAMHFGVAVAFFTLAGAAMSPAHAVEMEKGTVEKAFAVVPFETLGIGNESGCAKRALFAINDDTEWQRVWGVHISGVDDPQSLPKVDFSRQTVVAVLSGERGDGKSLQIAQIVRGARETVAYFMTSDEKSWLGVPELDSKTETIKKVQPYAFVAIDKVTGPLRFADVFSVDTACRKCAN